MYLQYPMDIHVWAKLMKSEVPLRPAIWPWRLLISCTSPWRRAGAWTSECMEPLPVWTRRRTWVGGESEWINMKQVDSGDGNICIYITPWNILMFLLGVIDGFLDVSGSALGCCVFWRSPLEHFLVDGEDMMVLVTKIAWFMLDMLGRH